MDILQEKNNNTKEIVIRYRDKNEFELIGDITQKIITRKGTHEESIDQL